MAYGIYIHGTPIGRATEHDGRWLVTYDPTQGFHGFIETTDDKSKARRFVSKEQAVMLWGLAHGLRSDGKPNRPLTAYTVSIEPLDE